MRTVANILLPVVLSCAGCTPLRWCGRALGVIRAPVVPTGTTTPPAASVSKGQGGEKFPMDVLLGWTVAGLLAGVGCWLVAPIKPLAPVALAGGIGCGVAVCFTAYLWQITAAAIGVTALTFGFMWLRRSKTLKKLVVQLQAKRETDPEFKVKMNEALDLAPADSKVIDNMRKGK